MDMRNIGLAGIVGAIALACTNLPAFAANGLAVPEPETLWPQWKARIAVQTGSLSPVTLSGRPASALVASSAASLNGGSASRGLQGAAVLGDYYFAKPSFGAFRASGGLLIGAQGGAPLLNTLAGNRLDLAVNNLGLNSVPPGQETPATVPYVGLGFTGGGWRSLAITADLGLVAERQANAGSIGRAVFGSQGMDTALREMRLSPVLQLGVRYTF